MFYYGLQLCPGIWVCKISKSGDMHLVSMFCEGVKCASKIFCSMYVGFKYSNILVD